MARVRRALGTRTVGHTGTLDPFATGLLVLLVGRATRLARFVEQQEKTYLAVATLGTATTTDDVTGEPTGRRADGPGNPQPILAEVEAALESFRGAQSQRPSTYSAKHVGGERAYARARRGEDVELAEVPIVVHALELVRYAYPEVEFRATVSPGTYLRALARDMGERLGCGAHLTALCREAIGGLRRSQAVPLDAVTPDGLVPPLAVLGHMARITVSAAEAAALGFGKAIPRDEPAAAPVLAVLAGDRLVAVGRLEGGAYHPEVVLEAAS